MDTVPLYPKINAHVQDLHHLTVLSVLRTHPETFMAFVNVRQTGQVNNVNSIMVNVIQSELGVMVHLITIAKSVCLILLSETPLPQGHVFAIQTGEA